MGVATEGLEGKVAIVTGAASGIGRATALLFCDAGAKVVAVDIDDKNGQETMNLIKTKKGEAIYVHCDLSKSVDIDAVVSKTLTEYGGIDILCNVAGIFLVAGLLDTSEEQWNKIINVNLRGTFLMCRAVIPVMLKQGGGKIVNVSSTSALVTVPNFSAYTASKGGVIHLTKQLAIEFAGKNININCVCPGIIDTPILKPLKDAGGEEGVRHISPSGQLGQPEEVGKVIVFLSSRAADLVNGSIMTVDGGIAAKMALA
jgi:NAD(P)-dependent dehydrogenase (short-subunit alcohol dehydrogenase family)